MAFCSFDGQMETDGEKGGGGELSHVKINWNRMVVSAGWWLVSAGGTRGVPPSLGPGAAAYPTAPLPGKGQSEAEKHRDSRPVSPVTPVARPHPLPPDPIHYPQSFLPPTQRGMERVSFGGRTSFSS